MFDAYTFFTDEEPEERFIHKGRHWFGRPSTRQHTLAQQATPHQIGYPAAGGISESRCDQLLVEYQSYTPLFKKLIQHIAPQ